MRIRLVLTVTGTERILPINYQYEISACIYRILHYGNAEFASWLHNNGYRAGQKAFKLFTFSNIHAERYKVFKDRFMILSDEVSLVLTFKVDEAVRHFISGLFARQRFSIGDNHSKVEFEVKTVETLAPPVFTENMTFQALSHLCVTKPVEKNGKLKAWYLPPDHPEYEERFFINLVNRYKAVHEDINGQFDDINQYRLELLGKPKSGLIKIKAGTRDETRIRGYRFSFACTAPVELLKFGYEAGFAEKGSLGFGCVGVKKGRA